MNDDRVNKINNAIKECLRQAFESPLPLAVLMQFTARLRDRHEFNDSELEVIDAGVRKMLSMMYKRAEHGRFEPLVNSSNSKASCEIAEPSSVPVNLESLHLR